MVNDVAVDCNDVDGNGVEVVDWNPASPLLQLSVVQHVITVPDVVEPTLEAVQLKHKYPLDTTAPFAQIVWVFKKNEK